MKLHTGYRVFARLSGISETDAGRVLDSFTLQGGVPEPVRVAKLLARARQGRSAGDVNVRDELHVVRPDLPHPSAGVLGLSPKDLASSSSSAALASAASAPEWCL